MRILIAVHGFPPTFYAGAERAAERIVHWLVAHGHQVEVFTIEKLDSPGFRMESTSQDGFTVHRLFYDIKQGDYFRNLYDYAPIGQALRELLARQRFDLVHMVSGYLLGGQVIHTAHDFGVPVVITLTEYWFMCARLNLLQPTDALCLGPENDRKCARCLLEEQRRYRLPAQSAPQLANAFWSLARHTPLLTGKTQAVALRRETLQKALDAADLVISPSHFLISKFAEFGFDTARYAFIRHGLAAPAVDGRPDHAPRGPHNPLRLGYIGQIKAHKGVDLVVDAAIDLLQSGASLRLDVWGPEHEAPDYAAQLRQRSAGFPAIRWHGRYSSAQVWEILSGFDALVVPSRWYENSPTVILEANSIGIPVIATRLGGMAELVAYDTSGLVFELNNPADLRRQIERLLQEPDLLSRLRAGVPHIKSADEEVAEIFAHYQQLIARQTRA